MLQSTIVIRIVIPMANAEWQQLSKYRPAHRPTTIATMRGIPRCLIYKGVRSVTSAAAINA